MEHGVQRANERGFTDARGNKVIVNEKDGNVSVHSNTKTGKYIPKPKNKNKNKKGNTDN